MSDHSNLPFNPLPIYETVVSHNTVIENGTTEEVIQLAKEFNIHDITNTNKRFNDVVSKIKDRLTKDGVDLETVR